MESHIKLINFVKKILPITEIIIERNSFDPHKLKNPEIKGSEYQRGDEYGFQNTRAYVLERDNYTCHFASAEDSCHRKLQTHHIKFRSDGGSDAAFNLITLCNKHHDQLHDGNLELDVIRHKGFKTATMMNVVRSQLFKRLAGITETYGYLTKMGRWDLGLEKSHANDLVSTEALLKIGNFG